MYAKAGVCIYIPVIHVCLFVDVCVCARLLAWICVCAFLMTPIEKDDEGLDAAELSIFLQHHGDNG